MRVELLGGSSINHTVKKENMQIKTFSPWEKMPVSVSVCIRKPHILLFFGSLKKSIKLVCIKQIHI